MPRKQHPPEQANPKQAVPLLERDGLIDSDELAPFLGVELSTLHAWASRGGGPAFTKVGRYRKYLPADVKAWLVHNRHEVTQEPAA
jgi:hypothetical protein